MKTQPKPYNNFVHNRIREERIRIRKQKALRLIDQALNVFLVFCILVSVAYGAAWVLVNWFNW